jgi:hypothetical protein
MYAASFSSNQEIPRFLLPRLQEPDSCPYSEQTNMLLLYVHGNEFVNFNSLRIL